MQLRGGFTTSDPRCDRLPSWDQRNINYPVRTLLPTTGTLTEKLWMNGKMTDQGAEGACVGFSWTVEAMTSPWRVRIGPNWDNPHFTNYPNDFGRKVYRKAQLIDEWAGEAYEGTSVTAGVKVLKNLGLISEYRWAFSMADIRDTLLYQGPVVLGINWYESMYDTRRSGLVTLGGDLVGGHAICLTGYVKSKTLTGENQAYELYRWRNTWGADYGVNGNGWIRAADLERLVFQENGEACVPVTRAFSRTGQYLS